MMNRYTLDFDRELEPETNSPEPDRAEAMEAPEAPWAYGAADRDDHLSALVLALADFMAWQIIDSK